MEQMLEELMREVKSKYFGKYRGFVIENEDPEQLGRVKVNVPSIMGEKVTGWALPCAPFGGMADQGFFTVPEVGAQVWVEFEAGELSYPIWVGTFWQSNGDTPAEAQLDEPTTRVFKTPSGHTLQFDDESGEEQIRLYHPKDAEMLIDKNGTISLTDAKGSKVTLDADASSIEIEDANGNKMTMDSSGTKVEDSNGNKIEMAASGITVEGTQVVVKGTQVMLGGQGGEPIIKGTSFLTLFATHMHTCTAPGAPSSPPIPQGEMSSLSAAVTST